MIDKIKYYFNFVLSTCVIIFFIVYGFYHYFVIAPANKEYAKNNPYLYKSLHYHRPNKEQLSKILDELTSEIVHNKYEEYYMDKGGSSSINLNRTFNTNESYYLTKKLEKIKRIRKIFIRERNSHCLAEMHVSIDTWRDVDVERSSISVGWNPSNDCRLYWWEGQNPRGLQNDIFKEYHKNGKQYNLIQLLEQDDENPTSEK